MNIKDVKNNKYYKVKYESSSCKNDTYYNKTENNKVYEFGYVYNGKFIIHTPSRLAFHSIERWISIYKITIKDTIILLEEIAKEDIEADALLELI